MVVDASSHNHYCSWVMASHFWSILARLLRIVTMLLCFAVGLLHTTANLLYNYAILFCIATEALHKTVSQNYTASLRIAKRLLRTTSSAQIRPSTLHCSLRHYHSTASQSLIFHCTIVRLCITTDLLHHRYNTPFRRYRNNHISLNTKPQDTLSTTELPITPSLLIFFLSYISLSYVAFLEITAVAGNQVTRAKFPRIIMRRNSGGF